MHSAGRPEGCVEGEEGVGAFFSRGAPSVDAATATGIADVLIVGRIGDVDEDLVELIDGAIDDVCVVDDQPAGFEPADLNFTKSRVVDEARG